MKLVVTQSFAGYQVGDSITGSEKIEEVLASHPGSVVKAVHDPDNATLALPLPVEAVIAAPASKATRR